MSEDPAKASDESSEPLSQEDIDAALAEAGIDPQAQVAQPTDAPVAEQPSAQQAAPEGQSTGAQADSDQQVPVDSAGRPYDEFAQAMAEAIAEEKAQQAEDAAAQPVDLPDFTAEAAEPEKVDLEKLHLLEDVQLNVRIELGRARMLVQDVLKLGEGSVVELDKLAGDPVDVYVNERLVARGEVLVLNDNFCVRINEIVAPLDEIAQ